MPSAVSTWISTPSADCDSSVTRAENSIFGVRKRAQPRDRHGGELVLLALHGERVGRLVLQAAEVELGDDGLGLAVPDAEQRLDQAALDHLIDHAEAGQHLQRRGVGGRRPRHVHDARLGLEDVNRDALAGDRQRGDEADRSAAGHQDGLLHYCHFDCRP